MRSIMLLAAMIAMPAMAGPSPERAAELERLVLHDCGSCHGLTLKGGLGPDIRAETLSGTPREALVSVILDGVPDTPMPPWRALLSEAEVDWLVEQLKRGSGVGP